MRGLDIISDAWACAYCAHVYYHTEFESPFSDETYDTLIDIIANRWNELTHELQEIFRSPDEMRITTMFIKLDPETLEMTREYAEF